MNGKTPQALFAVVALSSVISAPLAHAEFGDDPLTGLELPSMLADASGRPGEQAASGEAKTETGTETSGISELCAEFRADRDADLGKVLRACCEPTLAQMS